MRKLLDKFYNEDVEDFCTRLLYFFNTIDSYFFIAGLSSFFFYLVYFDVSYSVIPFLLIFGSVYGVYRICDFYPLFVLLSPFFLFFLLQMPDFSFQACGVLLALNTVVFVVIQILFMGIPDSIVSRDPTISFRKLWNSIFTIAPTTVSLSMSLFFSWLFSLILVFRPSPLENNGLLFWVTIFLAAGITYYFRPKSFVSENFKPETNGKIVDKVIVLNIDGCRLDKFKEANLPFLTALKEKNTYSPDGLQTVYRALTNPAFASILTGAVPEIHGIKNNNLGQTIKVEGLPDLVKSKLYGSMHVKHFSKPEWETKIVSLPTHGIYKSDDIMMDLLKEDLLADDGTRLFVADLSEVDFLGHAYGSDSLNYIEAIRRADKRIEEFFSYLKRKELMDDAVVIICSDHGMVRIDHSYLLSDAEIYVPFIISGEKIKNNLISYPASIMDITLTISYLLGIKYPSHSSGRVFIEAFS